MRVWHVAAVAFAVALAAGAAAAEEAEPPWLGVQMDNHPSIGVRLTNIIPQSPAAFAGLAPGDDLVSIDGEAIRDPADLKANVTAHAVGDTIEVRVYRDGRYHDIEVSLDESFPSDGEILFRRWVGRTVPSTADSYYGLDGTPRRLADHAGRVVLVHVFHTACCVETLRALSAAHSRHAADGLMVLGLSTENLRSMRAYAKRSPVDYELGSTISVNRLNTSASSFFLVVGKSGVVVYAGTDHGDAILAAKRALREKR